MTDKGISRIVEFGRQIGAVNEGPHQDEERDDGQAMIGGHVEHLLSGHRQASAQIYPVNRDPAVANRDQCLPDHIGANCRETDHANQDKSQSKGDAKQREQQDRGKADRR